MNDELKTENESETKTAKAGSRARVLVNVAFLIVLASALLFQNCGQFTAATLSLSYDGNSVGPITAAVLQPDTDRTDSQCRSKTEYDACIFLKNPVAAKRSSLSGPNAAELDTLQTYGVKLTGHNGQRLQNDTISVEVVNGNAVELGFTNLRSLSARNDNGRIVAQVMTYYWMNRAYEYISARTGRFPAKGKGIRVVVDDSVAGWSPATNSIHLKISEAGDPMAWNADLAIHFLALANLHFATNGAIRQGISAQHKTCGLKEAGCCSSTFGCSRAIASGVGDYMAAIIFPSQPTIGESWANNAQGLGFCNLSRDLDQAEKRSSQAAYDACASSGLPGEVTTMGTVYASTWWAIRKKAGLLDPDFGERDIDILFMAHLSELTGADTFSTALPKIIALESQLFKEKYDDIIANEFFARGL